MLADRIYDDQSLPSARKLLENTQCQFEESAADNDSDDDDLVIPYEEPLVDHY